MAERERDIESKIEALKEQACFKEFNEQEFAELATLLIEKKFSAGETIVNEGDPVDFVYIILKGDADVYKTRIVDQKCHDEKIATLSAGHSIGLSETGFYSLSGMRTATVIAHTDLETYRLGVAVFRGFTLANSHAHDVMKKLSEKS